ncbi:hypothetical protein R1sor_003531 [Riccia sorocarpa]|uniref:CCHC-type domain-containing protein n=1 Tax=Riccia sorocarpa TaxID=122646 RepID=A0ABD3H5T9_9MARC
MQTDVADGEELVRSRTKGKRPALERVSIDTGRDARPSNPTENPEEMLAQVLAELEALKKANEEKNSRIQMLETQANPMQRVLASSTSQRSTTDLVLLQRQRNSWMSLKNILKPKILIQSSIRFRFRLYKMTKFQDLCSELLKEAEKLTAVEPDHASTSKTPEALQNSEPPKKGEGSKKPWKEKSEFPFKQAKKDHDTQKKAASNNGVPTEETRAAIPCWICNKVGRRAKRCPKKVNPTSDNGRDDATKPDGGKGKDASTKPDKRKGKDDAAKCDGRKVKDDGAKRDRRKGKDDGAKHNRKVELVLQKGKGLLTSG